MFAKLIFPTGTLLYANMQGYYSGYCELYRRWRLYGRCA